MNDGRTSGLVLRTRIDGGTMEQAIARVDGWARARESRMVVAANVHVVTTASSDPDYQRVIDQSDMTVPDGVPLVWCLRRQGFPDQQRLFGPTLMQEWCAHAAREGLPIYLYGSTQATLDALVPRLQAAHPGLQVAGAVSPPFRPLTDAEDAAAVEAIEASGAAVVFVGLGAPKQERWMAEHRGRVPAVLIGVGAAFDYHAGNLRRAPTWMQRAGLEWLFRLVQEPRRLWRRYLVTNTLFCVRVACQVARGRWPRGGASHR
jgi:N-acetylglucosaminyldiphosphoundecaprenol N-acetyl-beta-D-mannosaminyltransferase